MKKTLSMKKIFPLVGMIVGLAFVLVGILSFTGFSRYPVYGSSAPYSYDSGFAQFGADYYSYSVNNSAEAASAARAAAANAANTFHFLKMFCGCASILFGLIVVCGFGLLFFSEDKSASKCTTSAPTTIASDASVIATDAAHSETAPVTTPVKSQEQ